MRRAGDDGVHADHAAVEAHARRADAVQALERVLEILGGDVAVERRAEAGVGAHLERVQRAALAHVGQPQGQLGDEPEPAGPGASTYSSSERNTPSMTGAVYVP
mgnify:CR=1 FL=1